MATDANYFLVIKFTKTFYFVFPKRHQFFILHVYYSFEWVMRIETIPSCSTAAWYMIAVFSSGLVQNMLSSRDVFTISVGTLAFVHLIVTNIECPSWSSRPR